MRAKRTLSLIAAAVTVTALAAVGATLVTGTDKKPPPKTGFIQGKVTSGDRPRRGRRVGDRRDIRPSDALPQDRRHRRPGPVRRSRAARGRLPGVGAWLRAPRLGEGARHGRAQGEGARRDRGRGRRHAAGGGGQLPGQLLAVALQAAREHAGAPGHAQPARLDERLQARLRALPPDGLGQRARHARQPGPASTPASRRPAAWTAPRSGLGRDALLDALADWGGRIAAGQVPEAPPRPKGIERNMVITQWAWGDLYTYAHDEIATDKRNPRLYPDGKIWGVDLGNDRLLSVDPVTHEADERHVPTVGGFNVPWGDQVPNAFRSLGDPAPGGSTPHFGAYKNPANPHNPMLDDTGKVWMTTQIRAERPQDFPAFCRDDPVIADERPPPAARLLRHQHRCSSSSSTPATAPTTCSSTRGQAVGERRRASCSAGSTRTSSTPARPETLERGAGLVGNEGGQRRRRREGHRQARLQLRDHPQPDRRQRLDGAAERRSRGHPPLRPRQRHVRGLRARRRLGTARAASTSTPRGSSGPAWAAAATWPSSTAPSAPAPGAPATSAPRAGPSTASPARRSTPAPDPRTRPAPTSSTTCGSTSSTRSAWARTR